MEDKKRIKLSEGNGGKEMQNLINNITKDLDRQGWEGSLEDSANLRLEENNLFLTTDSYVVTPLFFPGGNIGKIAFCGTVNDLVVRGAKPLGISLGLVIEEGFPKEEFSKIMQTIKEMSSEHKVPIVTGDTKVMEKGSIDKIIINTSGIGIAKEVVERPVNIGDKIIISGGIGEHGVALLTKRFELESDIISDSKPLIGEMQAIKHLIKQAKDITRGGLSAILNEFSKKWGKSIFIKEEAIPLKKEVKAFTELLGIDAYSLACEGRFACIVSEENSKEVLEELKKFNPTAQIIGEVQEGEKVIMQTKFGKRILDMPSGNIVPRIC